MWQEVLACSSGYIEKTQPDGGWRIYRQCCGSVWRRQHWWKAPIPREGTHYAAEETEPSWVRRMLEWVSVSPIYTQTHRDTGIESAYVTDRFAIQFKVVRRLIMSQDFWDTLKLDTVVLNPALVVVCYCDGMKGGTMTLLYNLLLKLDEY